MPIRTINHPDVEIREIDKSTIAPAIVGTTALVCGFAAQGPSYEPFTLSTMLDFEVIYGKPTNEAERYFYYGCKEVLDNGGRLITAKLPYVNDFEKFYKAVSLKVSATDTDTVYSVENDIVDTFTVSIANGIVTVASDVSVNNVNDVVGKVDIKGTLSGSFDLGAVSTHGKYKKINLAFERAAEMNATVAVVEVKLKQNLYVKYDATAKTYGLFVKETTGAYTQVNATPYTEGAKKVTIDNAASKIDASIVITYVQKTGTVPVPTEASYVIANGTLSVVFDVDHVLNDEPIKGKLKVAVDIEEGNDVLNAWTFTPAKTNGNALFSSVAFTPVANNKVKIVDKGDKIFEITLPGNKVVYASGTSLYNNFTSTASDPSTVADKLTKLDLTPTVTGATVQFSTTRGGKMLDSNAIKLLQKSGISAIKKIEVDYTNDIENNMLAAIEAGSPFGTTIPSADYVFALTNKSKATKFKEGYYIAVVDCLDAMYFQNIIDTKREVVVSMKTADGVKLKDFELARALSDYSEKNSVSRDVSLAFETINYINGGTALDKSSFDKVGIVLCKTYVDADNDNLLNVAVEEAYVGSLDKNAVDPASGQTTFICDLVNAESKFISAFADADVNYKGFDDKSIMYAKDYFTFNPDNELTSVSFTPEQSEERIVAFKVLQDIEEVFEKLKNIDEVEIDLVIDAGVSTIAEYCDTGDTEAEATFFVPELDADDRVIKDAEDIEVWRTSTSKYITFCERIRKDCMTIVDVPRNLVVDGSQKYIRKSKPTNRFANTIGPNLRYVTGLNSSYAALYSGWVKIIDDFTGNPMWLPASIKAAGVYLYTDKIAEIWDAPAGINRGQLRGAVDIAFNPSKSEADQVYTKGINYAKNYPIEGMILEGQKTTQVKPSAFDRVNVRRLFLRLERFVYKAARYFVYEANNEFTRRQFVDIITPIFQQTLTREGLSGYKIICDESNNTPDVIDRNELKIAILLKPARTAEFILVDFVATRSDASFSEIATQL